MTEQEPERKRVQARSTVSRRLPEGGLVELVYDSKEKKTRLAVFREGAVQMADSVTLDDGSELLPLAATNSLIRHEALLLPERPEPFGSVPELVSEIKAYLHRYLDLSDAFRTIASYYALLTWVYDAFNEVPYLRFRGDFGSGKTRALTVVGPLCYKAFFASGASTVSPIFHALDTFRGTLMLDEADFRWSDEKAELVKILNQGHARGFPVLRTMATAKRTFDPRAFTVFGPKIVAMRESFDDHALESRFLTEDMGQRGLRSEIPINLPDRQKDEALALRNKLLGYRFELLDRLHADESLVDLTLSPRLNQILVPLLSVVGEESLCTEIKRTVRSLEEALYADRASTAEAGILEVLREAFGNTGRASVPLSEITSTFVARHGADYDRPITNRYIGGILRRRLRIRTWKSHGIYVVPAAERPKIDELCLRYGVMDRRDKALEETLSDCRVAV